MRLSDIRPYLLYEVIAGSVAYGLNSPQSDLDIRGIFVLPTDEILGGRYVDQVNDTKQDIVYYEIGRFLELAAAGNPNILELLYMPDDCVRYLHPLFLSVLEKRTFFLTQRCKQSFGGYAEQQIKKATGLNKKINNPFPISRKSPLDFCWIIPKGSCQVVPAVLWLAAQQIAPESCGLTTIAHLPEFYCLYKAENIPYRGIVLEDSNALRLSSVPPTAHPIAFLYYNKDGYSVYCKKYKEYHDWLEVRNETRYLGNDGIGYDAKNMMHCIRLLRMAHEIATEKTIHVRRKDAAELRNIRLGVLSYDALLTEATTLNFELDKIYLQSNLPQSIDKELCFELLLHIRKNFIQ